MVLNHHPYRRGTAGVWLLGVALCLISGLAPAQDAAETEKENVVTNTPALQVDVRRNVEGTFDLYRYAFITSGPDKFTFLVPEQYRVDTSDPAKVKLASPDFSGLITLGLASGFPAGTRMNSDALREHVLATYHDAAISGEQTVCANGQSAPALDFTWKADSGITRMTRTTFIPTTGGLMEFTLTASPEKFEAGLQQLNLVLLTFRSGVNGRFDYVITSRNP
jgi:hypothetical protein